MFPITRFSFRRASCLVLFQTMLAATAFGFFSQGNSRDGQLIQATEPAKKYNLAALPLNNELGAIASLVVLGFEERTVLVKLDSGSSRSFFFKEKFDSSFYQGIPFIHVTPIGAMRCIESENLGKTFSPQGQQDLLLCEGGEKSSLFPWVGYLAQDFLGRQFSISYSRGELSLALPGISNIALFETLPLEITENQRMRVLTFIGNELEAATIDSHVSLTLADSQLLLDVPQAFKKLPLKIEAVDALGNPVQAEVYELRAITLGSFQVNSLIVAVTDLKKLIGSQTRERLILGGNFLSKFDWYFDLEKQNFGVKFFN